MSFSPPFLSFFTTWRELFAPPQIDGWIGAGHPHRRHGVGPDDGFSGYKAFGDPPRPRWGDYGAAAVSNGTIWLGSEYIAQRCSFTRYVTDAPNSPMFTCGNARTSLANWATRITAVRP